MRQQQAHTLAVAFVTGCEHSCCPTTKHAVKGKHGQMGQVPAVVWQHALHCRKLHFCLQAGRHGG